MRDMVETRERFLGRATLVAAGVALLATVAPARPARAQSDGFEFKPVWTITAENGSVGLSSDQSHRGATAAVLSSRSGGQRNIWLEHTYPAPRKGILSVWFNDTAAGTSTLYSGLYASNSATGEEFAVNVADWNPTTYVWHGPGVGETATAVTRSNGWHEFKLEVTATGFDASIDGVVVGSVPGDFAFDTVHLLLQGPGARPNATFYFDDFRYRRR